MVVQSPPARLFRGARCFLRGASMLLRSKRLLALAALPFLLCVLVYAAAFGGFLFIVDDVAGWVVEPGPWWRTLLHWGLMIGMSVGLVVASVLTYTAVAMVVAGPLYELLSAASERQLLGGVEEESSSLRAVAGDVAHAALFGIFLIVGGLFAFLFGLIIPPATTILATCGSAWLLALEHMDYPMGRRRLRMRQKLGWARRHAWEMLGLGLPVLLAMMIPFLGPFLLPFGVVGGTILFVETEAETGESHEDEGS
jgi:CysZ protein